MLTTDNRAKYDRDKLRYPSDLTDALPAMPRGIQREASPTSCVIDSQSAKSTEKGGRNVDPNGYDAGKKIKGKNVIFSSIRSASAVIEPLLPAEADCGRQRETKMRDVVSAVFHIAKPVGSLPVADAVEGVPAWCSDTSMPGGTAACGRRSTTCC